MRIGLVSDSPCDLPEELVERYQIEVVPAMLVLEGKTYLDGVEITRAEFYQRLPGLHSAPTTAAPGSQAFAARYQKLLDAGCEHVIGIFTAEKLTSMTNVARQAAAGFNGRVSVLESGSLSLGIGYQVLAAAEGIQKNWPLAQVLESIQSTRARLRIYAALDTMEYLRRSGRVPQSVAALGGLLCIKPVVELREGLVKPLGAPRTSRKAAARLLELLGGLGKLERLAILHTHAEARAREFLAECRASLGQQLPEETPLINVTTVIGTHVGPNGLGLAAIVAG